MKSQKQLWRNGLTKITQAFNFSAIICRKLKFLLEDNKSLMLLLHLWFWFWGCRVVLNHNYAKQSFFNSLATWKIWEFCSEPFACLFMGISSLLDTLLGCKSEDTVEGQLASDYTVLLTWLSCSCVYTLFPADCPWNYFECPDTIMPRP